MNFFNRNHGAVVWEHLYFLILLDLRPQKLPAEELRKKYSKGWLGILFCNFSFWSCSITANCLLVCAAISNLTHKWSFRTLNLDIYPVTLSLFSSICSRMLRKHGAFILMIYWYSLLCHERIAS